MSLLEKRKERGFWKKKTPVEIDVPISSPQLEELKQNGFVIVDYNGGRYQVVIKKDDWKKGEDVSETDLEIVPLPRAAKPSDN
jgi:hypothetical protein